MPGELIAWLRGVGGGLAERMTVWGLAASLVITAAAGAQKPKAVTYVDLEQDPTGRNWMLSRSGITVYDGRGFRTFAIFSKVPNTMLAVLAAGADGRMRTAPRATSGTNVIARPLWRRAWFYALTVTAVALAVVLGYHYLTRAIRRHNRELQAVNAELEEHIEQRRQATAALSASEEQYRSVVSVLAEGITVYDVDGRPVAHNASAERILGLTADQIAGRSLLDPRWQTLREDHSPFLVDEWPAMITLQEGRPLQGVVMGVCKPDGELSWISINTQPIFRGGERPDAVVASITDITQRKLAIAERERLIADLETKNKELERFTYTVSHDLKSPLVTIKGLLGLLARDAAVGDTERMNRDLERISGAAGTMGRLLDELLELSRVGRVVNPPEVVSLSELAGEAVDLAAGQIAERGAKVEIAADLPVIRGDRVRLLEVLQNLIENAVKFMGDQTVPRIEIGARRDADGESAQAVVYVRDNGIGIEARYHERIFGLFDRLDQGVEGTGVGLTLAQRIVEIHGGRIWVESTGAGQGATFCFTLPTAAEGESGALP